MIEKKGDFIICESLFQTRDSSEFEVKNMYDPVDQQTLNDLLAFTENRDDVLFFSYVYAKSAYRISDIVSIGQRTENCVTITTKCGSSYNVKGKIEDYLQLIS